MSKVTWRDAEPDDPMFKEEPQSYSPHWARTFLTPAKPSPSKKDKPQTEKPVSEDFSTSPTSSSRKT